MSFCFIRFWKLNQSNGIRYCLHTVEGVHESCLWLGGSFMWNGSNFLTNCIFKMFNRFRAITVYLWLEESPEKKNRTDLNQVCQIILPDPVHLALFSGVETTSLSMCNVQCLLFLQLCLFACLTWVATTIII